jgi:predicted ATPase
MLLSFSISNFRSFREEQTLSMVASNRQPDHADHLTNLADVGESLLPVAVIYGANGSGKSNLVKGLGLMQRLVVKGTQPEKKIPRDAFLLGGIGPDEPTSFDLRFLAAENVFNYGFRISETVVVEEWLDLVRGSRSINLFERVTRPDGNVVIEAGEALSEGSLGSHGKVLALTKVGVRANQLFLAGVRESLDTQGHGPLIQAVLHWFSALTIVAPDANFRRLAELVAKDADFADFAGRFLHDASTGVARLRVESTELSEDTPGFPSDLVRELLEDAQPGETRVRRVKGVGDIVAERGEGMKVTLRSIRAEHGAEGDKTVALPFDEESDGTRRLTHLLPALFQLRSEKKVYVIDEIDRSLHPLLSRKFIEFFLHACKGNGSQIIVTTHESNLMDLNLLRRDELWFTEKNHEGATSLYSLSDFKVRTDLKIDKGYLYGRFGAIPFLGNLDRLLTQLNGEAPCR